jgi:phage gpG-like protein
MDGVKVSVEGWSDWLAWNNKQINDLQSAIDAGMMKFTEHLEEKVQENIRRQGLVESGEMLRSIEFNLIDSTTVEWEGELLVAVEYAAIHEYGGVIHAKDGYLIFPSPDSNDLIYAEKVVIPAKPFIEPAVNSMRSMLDQFIYDELKDRGFFNE